MICCQSLPISYINDCRGASLVLEDLCDTEISFGDRKVDTGVAVVVDDNVDAYTEA